MLQVVVGTPGAIVGISISKASIVVLVAWSGLKLGNFNGNVAKPETWIEEEVSFFGSYHRCVRQSVTV